VAEKMFLAGFCPVAAHEGASLQVWARGMEKIQAVVDQLLDSKRAAGRMAFVISRLAWSQAWLTPRASSRTNKVGAAWAQQVTSDFRVAPIKIQHQSPEIPSGKPPWLKCPTSPFQLDHIYRLVLSAPESFHDNFITDFRTHKY
jgi:hypothetical protein